LTLIIHTCPFSQTVECDKGTSLSNPVDESAFCLHPALQKKNPQGIGASIQVVHYDCSKAHCCLCNDWHIKI